jgi:hypothetical protein
MATAYGSRSGVSRIVRGQVTFSDALYSVSPDVDHNNGTIELLQTAIIMDNAYSGYKIRFELRFENPADLTEYRLYKQNDLDGSTAMNLLAIGSTGVTLIIPNILSIVNTGWMGAAVVGDIIYIVTNSRISNDDADSIINDVEAEVDGILRKLSIIQTEEGAIPASLHFAVNPPVPRAITTYVNHASAFRMLNYVFDASKGTTAVGRDEERNHEDFYMAYKWLKTAQKALSEWIDSWYVANGGNAPTWSSTQPMVTRTGVEDQLHGVLEQEINQDNTTSDSEVDPFGDIESLLSY